MLKTASIFLFVTLMIACTAASSPKGGDMTVYHIKDDRQTTLADLVPVLLQHRVIIVGEHHTNRQHHRAQLRVIQALREAGAKVAVGLEMFRSDSQADLDRWIAGDIKESDFEKIYLDNWNYPWDAYRMIFDFARQERLPMIGLNVPREITGQVARKGFGSLSDKQRGKLSNVTCRVDDAYMDYIRKAFGAHAHGKMDFTYFCEAQLVWDTVMAVNTIEYLNTHPDAIVVLLCGAGHAQKGAIPRQLRSRSDLAHLVLLPEAADSISVDTISFEDADYLLRSN